MDSGYYVMRYMKITFMIAMFRIMIKDKLMKSELNGRVMFFSCEYCDA
ncbi:hypothetical protein SOVF_165500 [Spinacia oleracea]|nr:hypothetical protein SOVF_165500 [Spinacia oleracea]